MKFTDEEYTLLYKKLEYKFKNSGNPLVDKIKNKENLSKEDVVLLYKKLEYTFRKSENPIIKKLADIAEIDNFPIKYSNISAKKKRDFREDEKTKLKHLESFKNFI